MLISDIREIRFDFNCSSHKKETTKWTMYDVMDKGTPICSKCGEDMILSQKQELNKMFEKIRIQD